MLKSPNENEIIFKWEVKVGGDVFELSDKSFQQLLQAEKEGKRLIKIGNKVINPAFISSSKKIFKNPINEFVDWSALEKAPVNKIPENLKTVTDEKALENRQKIKDDLKKLLKNRNANWKPVVRDQKHRLAIDDVWEHLKSSITTLKFPTNDLNWKIDPSIASHNEGRETHPVTYKTQIIDLGDKYDHHFWAEAGFIFCNVCNKQLKKQITIWNEYDSDCVVRNL